jgi:hemerythrin
MDEKIKRFKLGFDEMDVQHDYLYNLFECIEKTHILMDVFYTKRLLREIENYIMFHFECEERLMRMYGVLTFTVHKSDHEQFEQRVAAFIDDFEANRLDPKNLRMVLSEWLYEHSRVSDSEYVTFINRKREDILLNI